MGRTMNDAAKWWYYIRQNGGYYPQSVANLGYSVWDWDASRQTGVVNGSLQTLLYQDSAKTTPVTANSDPVGAWVDGVQGVDAIQATTANKPTYVTASLNGLPTLEFDGSDLLATGNITVGTFAVWFVFNATVGGTIASHTTDPVSVDGFNINTFGTNSIQVRRTIRASKNGADLSGSVNRIVRFEHNGTYATFKYFNNGSEIATTDNTINDVGTGTATQPLFIGARTGVLFPITAKFAHLCIVSPYPTPAIIAQMETYINGIWSVY